MQLTEIFKKSEARLIKELETNENGLSARQAEKRQSTYGYNEFKKEKNGWLVILWRQINNSLFYILLVGALISFFLSIHDFYIILAVLFFNTLLGFIEEYRSEKAVEKLDKFINRKIIVRRDSIETLLEEKQLVPGDIVILKEGDIVPADIRLLRSDNLAVDESQLTGESNPIQKIAIKALSPKETLLFAGSTIQTGEAVGIVFNTGSETELGKIAKLSASAKKITKYEKALGSFSQSLVKIAFISLVIVFVLKAVLGYSSFNLYEVLLFIVALALAVVPEALPIIATVTLSVGALKLARKHVVVKSLEAMEDFGNVNILCTDKTGTLTENKMSVTKISSDDNALLKRFAINSVGTEKLKNKVNPFYEAIFNYIPRSEVPLTKESMIKEIPFDSAAKRSRVVLKEGDKYFLLSIGSVETLLDFSLTLKKQLYLEEISKDGESGLRHLGFAYKQIDYDEKVNPLKFEKDMKFLGFFTFENPLKKTAKETIQLAEKMGISIKVLSGDSREVTRFVASEVGLISKSNQVLTGQDIEKLSDDQLELEVQNNSAFARLSPEQKYRIIRILKRKNTVAYQGDGVNDAPSMKLADVSIAVNSATDIAKASADIILLNNDLEVVINGLRYGRSVFANINKYIKHTMVGNFGNFFALALLFLFAKDLPLSPIQLLLTNLLTDLPLIAISTDNVSHQEVIKPSHHDLKRLMNSSVILGFVTAVFILIFFFFVKTTGGAGMTELFLFITVSQLAIIFSVRTQKILLQANKPSRALISSFILILITSIFMIYYKPIAALFSLRPLPIVNLLAILGFTGIFIATLDACKLLANKIWDNKKTEPFRLSVPSAGGGWPDGTS